MKQKQGQEPAKLAKVKKGYTRRFYMMALSVLGAVVGLFLFVVYFNTLNIAIGLLATILIVGAIFLFKHYYNSDDSISVEHIAGEKIDMDANCINLYADRIMFENMPKPEGFPRFVKNLNKRFYVNIWSGMCLIPFILPDQQYCDPGIFAQRVLGLPAHRKIFERKPKLMQKLKTALLVLAIGIMWLLIMTTT